MARQSGIRNLRQDQVDAIIRSFHEGLTSRQVSEIQGVSIRCVQRIWKKYKDTGSVKSKNTQEQRERRLVLSTGTLFGSQATIRVSLQPRFCAKYRRPKDRTHL
ncbi:hypothetical protein V3C99_006294 [Haemonchus contortus]